MTLFPLKQKADAKESHQGELAFTMIEIALAIGVIGFALVAIIGILPRGMTSQKNGREETSISEDAQYFIDAIRNGVVMTNGNFGHSLDFLTNNVVFISSNYVGASYLPSNPLTNVIFPSGISTTNGGAEIIGLLSTPNTYSFNSNNYIYTRAIVRSLSSSAAEQGANSTITAFTYQMDVEIFPYNQFPANTSYQGPNYFLEVGNTNTSTSPGPLTYNLWNVRLRFRWPVLNLQKSSQGQNLSYTYGLGDGQQVYRTLIGSQIVPFTIPFHNQQTFWSFQPQTFTNSPPSL